MSKPAVGTSVLFGLDNCPLHKRTPFGIRNVSATQFSVARYSGGCTYNGDHFIYVAPTDELIRADVLKWKKKAQKNVPVPNDKDEPSDMIDELQFLPLPHGQAEARPAQNTNHEKTN